MRFSFAAVLALATSALAQTPGFDVISKPGKNEQVPAGSTFDIKWDPASHDGTVTLSLIGGPEPAKLDVLQEIAKSVDNSAGSYSWSVSKDLGQHAVYGIKITSDKDTTVFQFSFPFQISGGATGSASGSATVTLITASGNSTVTKTSSSSFISSYPVSNLTTTASSSKTTLTGTGTGSGSSSTSKTTSSGPTAPTSGAAPIMGSTIALFGGLAVALFTL